MFFFTRRYVLHVEIMAEGPFKSGCCNLFFEAKVGHAYRMNITEPHFDV